MDIHLELETGDFTLRAAVLIIQNDNLLVIKNDDCDCFYTIGGKIKTNETSFQAASREALEETGFPFQPERLVFLQERFYKTQNQHHHKIVFFYLMQPLDVIIPNGVHTDHPKESLLWLPVKELAQTNLLLEFLKTELTNIPKEVLHIISQESF